MFSTSIYPRTAAFFAAVSVFAMLLGVPGVASADKLMLSEITVVAVALDTESGPQEVADDLNEAALASVKDQIEADTKAYLASVQAELPVAVADLSDES